MRVQRGSREAILIKKYEKVKVTRGERHPYLGMIANFQQPGVVVIGNPGFMLDLLKEYGVATFSTTPAGESGGENLLHFQFQMRNISTLSSQSYSTSAREPGLTF